MMMTFVELGSTWLRVDAIEALQPAGAGKLPPKYTTVWMTSGEHWTVSEPIDVVLAQIRAAADKNEERTVELNSR
jgi:hypothetical protein